MARILVVEDEPAMQGGLRDNLEVDGYEVTVVGDGQEGIRNLVGYTWDLVILDVMLPKKSGYDVLREARAKGVRTPVIMLTAKGEEVDKVLGLELGADDYITKPFSLREFLARVKAVLRRSEVSPGLQTKVTIGVTEIDLAAYTAVRGGEEIPMTSKEIEILKFLYEHRNTTVTRDQLLTEVWGYDESVSTRTVDNFILRLRQKIEMDPAHPRAILTIHGAGYKLVV
jgi:DNA-binding response OmpR family regulator